MNQKGFTLVELVVVIVVLGILAAVAVPKFVDLSAEAEEAGVQATAGALGAASALNYAKAKAGNGGESVKDCTDVAGLVDNFDAGKFSITPEAFTEANSPNECEAFVVDNTGMKATFSALYVSN